MSKSIIKNFIAKMVAGRADDGIMITLSDPRKVDFQTAIMEDLLMRNGIDPRAITSEEQLKMLLNQIDAMNKQSTTTSGIRNAESAKVFDLKGRKIEDTDNIMGGEEMPPPGSRGGKDDIAAPVQSAEGSLRDMTEAEIKANLEAQNKSTIKKILERKNREDVYGLEDYDTTNMSEIKKEIIRTETKLGNLNPNSPDFRERAKPLVDKIEALKNKMRDDKADGGRIGFFMGSQFPKGLATLREMVKFFSKGKDKERTGSEILKLVNPKQFNKLLEDPKIYNKFDVEKGIGAPELIKNMQADMTKNRKMMVEEILGAARNIRQSDINTMERKKEMVEEMMKRGIDRETAEGMADTLSTMAEAAAGMRSTPKLTDEGILELENVLKNMETGGKKKRDLNADGGRIGLKDGMNRRTFLKFLAGFASIPIIGKIVKPLKTVKGVKNVPIIKTGDVPGKPEWFDQLVNKVIIEGEDVTKRFATQERQVVHMKKIDDETSVMVTQDLNDGSIMVDVDDPIRNVMGESGQDTSVTMMLKKGQADETTKGTPADEFSFTENDMRNYMDGPDDYTTEFTENTVNKMKDLTSDLGKIKEYATGKKQTMKEFIESKKRKDKVAFAERNPSEYASERGPDIDYSDYDDGMASGGIAGMLGE